MPETPSAAILAVVVTGREPLVGRQTELAYLEDRIAAARAGAGQVVVVCGAAGIGKTRLVEELVATASDVHVGWGAALDDSGMPPLWPWTRAVRDLPVLSAAVAAVAAGADQRRYGTAADAAAAAFAADTQVVEALSEQTSSAGTLLLVLDDLQWADGATLRLLGRVGRESGRLPLLIVGTHRDPAGGSLPRSSARGASDIVTLPPLTREESVVLLSEAVTNPDLAAVSRAAELSGGSPLYLKTISRVAAEQLRGREPWAETVGESPELRHLVAAAMHSVGPDTAHAIQGLSVLGEEAELTLLAQLLGLDSPAAASELLQPAVPAGLVRRLATSAKGARFAHSLVRDATYASISPQQRAALHRRAAELLAPLAISRDDRAGMVAFHWDRAGEPGNAVEWAIRAADAARAAGAHEEAVVHLTLALDTIDANASSGELLDRADLLLSLAREQYLAGRVGNSLDACERAADDGERTGRAEIVAMAAITVQGIGHSAANIRIASLCRRALTLLGDVGAPDLRARVEAQLVCALVELDATEEAARLSRSALARATASGDPDVELDAIRARAMLEWWLPDMDEELFTLGGRSIELAGSARRPLAQLWGHAWRSESAIRRCDPAMAQSEVEAIKVLADRSGLPLVRWHALRRQATLAALTGNFAGCRTLAAQAAQIAADWEDEAPRFTRFGQSVCLAIVRGDPGELPSEWMKYADVSRIPPIGHAAVATALMITGDLASATAIYEPITHRIPAMRRGIMLDAWIFYLVAMAQRLGDAATCAAVKRLLTTQFGKSPILGAGTVFYPGSIARMAAEMDLARGEHASAVTNFEEGLRVDAALGARPFVARGRLGLARARIAMGDQVRAVNDARAAAGDARRLDMPGLLAEADAFLADVAAKARAQDPLTAREREVAELVAQALSNREVARVLVVSERTVESHVRSILVKTGLKSRTEITRWWLQRPHLTPDLPRGS